LCALSLSVKQINKILKKKRERERSPERLRYPPRKKDAILAWMRRELEHLGTVPGDSKSSPICGKS